MNHDEFREAFAGLTVIYGEKTYPGPIRAMLFRTLMRLSKIDLMRVIDNLIMEHTKAPAAGIILRASQPFLRTSDAQLQAKAIRELEARPGRCHLCDNAGVIFLYAKENPAHEFAFRCCECESSQVRKISFPPWHSRLSESYLTLKEKWAQEAAVGLHKLGSQATEGKTLPETKAAILATLRQLPKYDPFLDGVADEW